MAGKLSPVLLVVSADVDPAHEEEFNHWYNTDHVPNIVKCPGFIACRRYNSTYGEPRYLAIYELESEAALTTPEFKKERGWFEMMPHIRNFHERIYKQIFEYEK
ncbi:MAG: DUF4286 family protein [Nitrospinota bacterium]